MDTILLVGTPNSGKSTIFNLLSGEFRKVSNYAGVTVDTGVAELKSNNLHEHKIRIVDLPGVNSLVPTSVDEAVTLAALMGRDPRIGGYQQVVVILEYPRLESSLALTIKLIEMLGPEKVALVINKTDNLEWITALQKQQLSHQLKVPVFTTSALKLTDKSLDTFIRSIDKQKLEESSNFKINLPATSLKYFPEELKGNLIEAQDHEKVLMDMAKNQQQARTLIKDIFGNLYLKGNVTQKLDGVILHPFWGPVIFCAIFYLFFHSIYTFASPLMDLVEALVAYTSETVSAFVSNEMLRSFLVDGVIAGVGGVIIFLPQIMILFFLLGVLEQSGYIARAAFVSDRFMAFFGLNGKAFLPYMSGFACAVPAIMSARTIPNRLERFATMLTLPLVTCSARLPVYVLLIGTFIPDTTVLGIFNARALSFFFLYFLGSIFALIMAKIFRLTMYRGKTDSFFMDLPLYQPPSMRMAGKQMLMKGKLFLKKAGTIILALSMLIWVLSVFPKVSDEMSAGKSENEVASIQLEHSYIGKIGKIIEPVIAPLGMNWKMGIGLLVSFGARELFVSAMSTIYSIGADDDEENSTLRERLMTEVNPETGKPVYNLAVAWSLLLFFVFSLQCTSTLAIVKRETGSWKYPMLMFAYMGGLGYAASFLAYRLLL